MNNDNSSKQILLSVLGVAILVVAVVGVSFAAFTYTKKGTKENVVTTGTIKFEYLEEGESRNAISIDNAMPMSDEQGKNQSEDKERFDFTVKATITGKTTITYSIAVEKVNISDGTALEDKYVNFNLVETDALGGDKKSDTNVDITKKGYTPTAKNDTTGCPETAMEMLQNATFDSNGGTRYYTLRMWVNTDYGASDTEGQSFSTAKKYTVKVNVYAKGNVA